MRRLALIAFGMAALTASVTAVACGGSASVSPKNHAPPSGVDDTAIAMAQASADLADSAEPSATAISRDPNAPMGAPDTCDAAFPNDRIITPDSESAAARAPTPDEAKQRGLACYVALHDDHSSWCCRAVMP